MSRIIKVATIQMDANPAPVNERLNRAEKLITQAAQEGAQLVVLPELFNIGYAYTDKNFDLAEPLEGGLTTTWMKASASRLNIHPAGTLLVLEDFEIYDSLFLFSPSGQRWRYDKNYLWAWERGYFRGRRGMTIANTELGDLGLMICWDLGHLKLWSQYAGKVDLMLLSSCPPDAIGADLQLSDNQKLDFEASGTALELLKDAGAQFFGGMANQQAKWLHVPVINSGASGLVHTPIPKSEALLRNLAFPTRQSINDLPKDKSLKMTCEMIPSCKIVDANGQVIAERLPNHGEGYVTAEVTIPGAKSMPTGPRPKPPLKWFAAQMAIINSGIIIPATMKSIYKNGIKSLKQQSALIRESALRRQTNKSDSLL